MLASKNNNFYSFYSLFYRTVSRRSEPSSRATLIGEQPNPWNLLQPQDVTSRHRGAKPLRRFELLGAISLLSPEYLLSYERWPSHEEPPDHFARLSSLVNGFLKLPPNHHFGSASEYGELNSCVVQSLRLFRRLSSLRKEVPVLADVSRHTYPDSAFVLLGLPRFLLS